MPIKSIEVICIPCPKCTPLKPKIDEIIRGIEMRNKIKIIYEFKQTPNLAEISKYALNPSQTPAVIINGNVEIAGQVNMLILKNRLEAINRH
jgi:hypothetical protein